MRSRILTVAVALVIGAAAATLAQHQEDPRSRRVAATRIALAPFQEPLPRELPSATEPVLELEPLPAIPAPVEHTDVVALPKDPSPAPALPPPVPTPTDPNATASAFVTKANDEIARLQGEKREAEKELARVKARIRAAEIGIAKWQSLAKAMTTAMANNETTPDDPVGRVELIPQPSEPLPLPPPREPTLAPDPTP